MAQIRTIKQERLVTVATIVVLAATLGLGAWLAISFVWPSLIKAELPTNVVDLRMKAAPELPELTGFQGGKLSEDLAREHVIVAFLLTTCPACNLAKPVLDELWLGGEIGVVGIFAESEEAVSAYSTQFPRYNDPSRGTFEAFGALTLPAIYVVDSGVVTAQSAGWAPSIERSLRASAKGGD